MRRFKDNTTYNEPAMWIDSKGQLWMGPTSPDSYLHFSRFHGFNHLTKEIWVLESSECPEDCVQVEYPGKKVPYFGSEANCSLKGRNHKQVMADVIQTLPPKDYPYTEVKAGKSVVILVKYEDDWCIVDPGNEYALEIIEYKYLRPWKGDE